MAHRAVLLEAAQGGDLVEAREGRLLVHDLLGRRLGHDFVARLQARLADWEAKLAPLKAVPLVAYHNSWPYFARRFRLDFAGFIEIKPGVPPSPSHLAGIIETMRTRGVRIVVREPHEPERDAAFVAGKAGAKVVTLAASVGALPGTDDYLSLFDTNIGALAAAVAR